MTEAEYRQQVQTTFDIIDRAFQGIDPDLAECEQALGAMTISFEDRTRCILSAQPSVRQLWVALASKGTAYHFNYDPARGEWMDDKGRGIELLSFLEKFLEEKTGQKVRFRT